MPYGRRLPEGSDQKRPIFQGTVQGRAGTNRVAVTVLGEVRHKVLQELSSGSSGTVHNRRYVLQGITAIRCHTSYTGIKSKGDQWASGLLSCRRALEVTAETRRPQPSRMRRWEDMMAIGLMWNYQAVELSGVPAEDEATLNPFGLIGYELVAVTTVAATGQLVAYLKRGTLPEDAEDE